VCLSVFFNAGNLPESPLCFSERLKQPKIASLADVSGNATERKRPLVAVSGLIFSEILEIYETCVC